MFYRIDTADILILVIDLRVYFEPLIQQGLLSFLNSHLNQSLKVEFSSSSLKNIIIAFNKSDLLDSKQLEIFDKIVRNNKNEQTNIGVAKISCTSENIDELLNDLQMRLQNL